MIRNLLFEGLLEHFVTFNTENWLQYNVKYMYKYNDQNKFSIMSTRTMYKSNASLRIGGH